jgi:Flp pilus assembly pilin Flp
MKLKTIIRQLWRDERGFTAPAGLILVTTLVALGAIVGLAHFRDQIAQQFGDAAVALDRLDQSFSYRIQIDANGNGTIEPGEYDSGLIQNVDNVSPQMTDNADDPPACIEFYAPTAGEVPANAPGGQFP